MTNGTLVLNWKMEVHTMSQSSTITSALRDAASGVTVGCHPGEVVREEFMVSLGLSANKFALA
jgi:hypothetical protein